MKKFLPVLVLSLSASVFATSLMHPYTWSQNEITDLMKNQEVSKRLFPLDEMVNSIERTKTGWEIKTDHCRLEVTVKWEPLAHPRPLPFPQAERKVYVGECK